MNEYDPEEGLQEGEIKIIIESGDGNPVISQFSQEELSQAGQTMLNKMKNTLNNFHTPKDSENVYNLDGPVYVSDDYMDWERLVRTINATSTALKTGAQEIEAGGNGYQVRFGESVILKDYIDL